MSDTKNKQNINKTDSTIQNSASVANLNYSGKIKINLCKGKKVLKSKTYSNNGCGPLFKFIAQCLQGNYRQAEKLRPNKIQLYSNLATRPDSANYFGDDVHPITGFVTSNSPADIGEIRNGEHIIGFKTVLHFLVPAVYIDKESLKNPDDINKPFSINQISLYSTKEYNISNCSAFFYLTKEIKETTAEGSEEVIGVDWDGIGYDDLSENLNLLIDWEMSIENKSVGEIIDTTEELGGN